MFTDSVRAISCARVDSPAPIEALRSIKPGQNLDVTPLGASGLYLGIEAALRLTGQCGEQKCYWRCNNFIKHLCKKSVNYDHCNTKDS